MKKIFLNKPKILYGIPIAIFSLEVYFGMLLGYFIANFWSLKFESITFNIGKYKFHLHHWMLGLMFLLLIFVYKFSPLPIQFSFGFFGGLIFQGIFCYDDWHKILKKQ